MNIRHKIRRLFADSFFFLITVIYLFIIIIFYFFGCVGSSLRCTGFSLWWLLLLRNTGSRGAAFSSCGSQAQWLWLTGLVAPRHVGSSRTRARTRVPCIGRQILNHWATREVRWFLFSFLNVFYLSTVDLQCYVSFWCTAKWFSFIYICIYIYTRIYSFSYSFPLWFITRY